MDKQNIVRNFANMKIDEIKKVELPYSDEQKQMAAIAKALSHPVRVYVMQFLSKQSCCYSGDLTEVLPIAKSTLSQHLKELKNAGLIKGELETPKIKYCLDTENWKNAQKLIKELFQI